VVAFQGKVFIKIQFLSVVGPFPQHKLATGHSLVAVDHSQSMMDRSQNLQRTKRVPIPQRERLILELANEKSLQILQYHHHQLHPRCQFTLPVSYLTPPLLTTLLLHLQVGFQQKHLLLGQ